MKILNIPIEPIEERYSTQWDRWFQEKFTEAGLDFVTIYGNETSGKINAGAFLDVLETNQYKASQLIKIIDYIKAYQDVPIVLFFHDLWFPGLETIAYIRDGLGLDNLKICGCLHAGSYDEWDFLNKVGMTPWAQHIENGWFGKIVDQIYVATEFHKSLLCFHRKVQPDKVRVTGFPLYPDFLPEIMPHKENIIVFPHRLHEEKQPDLFTRMCFELSEENWEWRWIMTKNVVKTKKEYYELLGKSRIAVSFARQETWGIAMQEAVLCGCFPICPNRLSYTELYYPEFLYDSFEEAKQLVQRIIRHPRMGILRALQTRIITRGEGAIPNIVRNIQEYEV